MHLLALIVDLLQKRHVLSHDLRVLLLVDVLIFLKHCPQVVYVVLEILTLLRVLLVQICIASFSLHLLLNVFLVKSDNSSLQFLEVCDLMQALVDVVLKTLLVCFLLI